MTVVRNDRAARRRGAKRRAALARRIRRLILEEGFGVDDARVKTGTSALAIWGALRLLRPETDPWVSLARRRAVEEAARAKS